MVDLVSAWQFFEFQSLTFTQNFKVQRISVFCQRDNYKKNDYPKENRCLSSVKTVTHNLLVILSSSFKLVRINRLYPSINSTSFFFCKCEISNNNIFLLLSQTFYTKHKATLSLVDSHQEENTYIINQSFFYLSLFYLTRYQHEALTNWDLSIRKFLNQPSYHVEFNKAQN